MDYLPYASEAAHQAFSGHFWQTWWIYNLELMTQPRLTCG